MKMKMILTRTGMMKKTILEMAPIKKSITQAPILKRKMDLIQKLIFLKATAGLSKTRRVAQISQISRVSYQ